MKKFLACIVFLCIAFSEFGAMPVCAQTKLFSRINKDKITDNEKYSYVNIDWWSRFNDENLNEYINKAVENNNDLKMAKYASEEYYQAMKLQFSKELPQAGAGFAPIDYKLPETNNYDWRFFFPIAVNYEADFFLKNHDKTKSAKKTYEMSLLDEKAVYISVASGIGTVYFNIVKLGNIIQIQEKIVNIRKQIYELMKKSNYKGLISASDAVEAEKAYTQGQIELSDLEKSREKLLNQLCIMISESPENSEKLLITAFDKINFSGGIPSEISTDVIFQRPDYLKAEKMVQKAGLDVKIAKKEFLPSFNIAGLALFNASNFGSALTTTNSLLAFGAGIFEPLYTGGARIANLRLRKASYERILENYKKTNLIAMQEINDSLVAIKKDKEKLNKTLKQQNLSQKNYFYNEKRYANGLISRLDLLQAEESLLIINKLVIAQKIDNYVGYISLYKAVGGKL